MEILQQCEPILKLIIEKDAPNDSDVSSNDKMSIKKSSKMKDNLSNPLNDNKEILNDDTEAEFKLLTLFEQRLQHILKNLIQICLQKHSNMKKDCDNMLSFYKSAYSLTLKTEKFEYKEIRLFANRLYKILLNIKDCAKMNQV